MVAFLENGAPARGQLLTKHYDLGGSLDRFPRCFFLNQSMLVQHSLLPLLYLLKRFLRAKMTPLNRLFYSLALHVPDFHVVEIPPCAHQMLERQLDLQGSRLNFGLQNTLFVKKFLSETASESLTAPADISGFVLFVLVSKNARLWSTVRVGNLPVLS